MPGFDGTGPMGQGSRTGWGRGRCRPRDVAPPPVSSGGEGTAPAGGPLNMADGGPAGMPGPGWGFGRGRGAGRGRGFRWGAGPGAGPGADAGPGAGRGMAWRNRFGQGGRGR